jgi:hypothetical protein
LALEVLEMVEILDEEAVKLSRRFVSLEEVHKSASNMNVANILRPRLIDSATVVATGVLAIEDGESWFENDN